MLSPDMTALSPRPTRFQRIDSLTWSSDSGEHSGKGHTTCRRSIRSPRYRKLSVEHCSQGRYARCTGSKAHATRDDIKKLLSQIWDLISKHSPTADSMPKGSSAAWGSETLSEPEEHNEPVNIHLNVASNHQVSLSR